MRPLILSPPKTPETEPHKTLDTTDTPKKKVRKLRPVTLLIPRKPLIETMKVILDNLVLNFTVLKSKKFKAFLLYAFLIIFLMFILYLHLEIFSSPLYLDSINDSTNINEMSPMPGVRCPNCLKRDIVQWVLPGKHCPKCSTPC